jgi:hypothetical protein
MPPRLGQYPLLIGILSDSQACFFGVFWSHSRLAIGPGGTGIAPQGEPQDLAAIPGYYRTLAAMQCEDNEETWSSIINLGGKIQTSPTRINPNRRTSLRIAINPNTSADGTIDRQKSCQSLITV